MKVTQQQLEHLVLLTDMVLNGEKSGAMEDMLQCLLFVVKSVGEAELPDSVADELAKTVARVEERLREENVRHNMVELYRKKKEQPEPIG
ncbi:hypothetical protein J31TS4_12510 [Paenibacillus sp. J31TS4]|uniref:hypothetical protein n=1 Tax=Paenibacillus sp. J31TS4 TaxID=2807195 RepID=UPI001B1C23AF|nr:hypothetical protein [Paenibacillus sp. J31TS4]GIP37971.1 hypothetical protein J31TS4_12510 [Paenibacillus sp. J31TS4]